MTGFNAISEVLKGIGENDKSQEESNGIDLKKIIIPEYQSRKWIDANKLNDLVADIGTHGVLQPLLVTKNSAGDYSLVAGLRRYKAATLAGLAEVPVNIVNLDYLTARKAHLSENLLREDLNIIEQTEAIIELLMLATKLERDKLISTLHRTRNNIVGNTNRNVSVNDVEQESVISDILKSYGLTPKSFVETRLPTLNLPSNVYMTVLEGKLQYTKALEIAKIKDDGKRDELLQEAIANNLSVKEIKERVRAIKDATAKPKPQPRLKARVSTMMTRFNKGKGWERLDKEPERREELEALLEEFEARAQKILDTA